MNKETFASIMTEAFSSYGRDMTTNSGKLIMASWFKYFGDRDENKFRRALDRHILNKNQQPKVSDIIELIGNNQKDGRGKHVCPGCGSETDHLYVLGPDMPKSVCCDCHTEAHKKSRLPEDSRNNADMAYLDALATEHKVNPIGIATHLAAANRKNIDINTYLQDLPRGYEQYSEYLKGKKITIGGRPYKGK